MPRPRMKELVPPDDMPAAAVVQKFVTMFVNYRDLKQAACLVGLDAKMGPVLYKEPKVRAAIDRKILLVDIEDAKVKAQANQLTVDRLDAALFEEVKSKKNGHVRVRAIELGYRRRGMIREGEFYVAPDPTKGNNAPSMYRAHQTTLRQTVTTEVTHTAAEVIPPTQQPDPIFAVQEY